MVFPWVFQWVFPRFRLGHGHQPQGHPAAVQIRPAPQQLRDLCCALGEGTAGGALHGGTVGIEAQIQQAADPGTHGKVLDVTMMLGNSYFFSVGRVYVDGIR